MKETNNPPPQTKKKKKQKKKKKKNKLKNNNKFTWFTNRSKKHYCVEVFQIITWKERTVYMLSKYLHQSVPNAHNESCLAYKETENG